MEEFAEEWPARLETALADRDADTTEWHFNSRKGDWGSIFKHGWWRRRDDLAGIDPAGESPDVLTGNAFDRESLDDIAQQTSVVCTTGGPYAEYGSGLVAACMDQRTDYCDLTGEIHWMQRIIDQHHETARERDVRIVHGCGFDSIPSDIGTLYVQEYAKEAFGTPCSRIKSYVTIEWSDLSRRVHAISGGTMASMLGLYEAGAEDHEAKQAIQNPYALAPAGERGAPDSDMQVVPTYDETIEQWTAPFVMASYNEKVVRRSNALLEYLWGRDFRYGESTSTGDGIAGAAVATGMATGLRGLVGVMSTGPLRTIVDSYLLPDPGEGPSRETMEAFSYTVRLIGKGTAPESGEEFTVGGTVADDCHPGYASASRMLAESALCLARGDTETPLEGAC